MIESMVVTVNCPDCGPGLAQLQHVSLRINRETDRASLAFPCAVCHIRSARDISLLAVTILRDAGVVPVYWTYPRELAERLDKTRNAFPEDSVERLASELDTDIDAFLRSG